VAIVVTRTGVIAGSTSFQALSNLAASSVSSSFTVASNMTAIKNITVGQAVDATGESFQGLIKISGNCMKDGDAVFCIGGQNTIGTSTGANQNYISIDTSLAVQPGNSCEISYAQVGDTATVDVAATIQFN